MRGHATPDWALQFLQPVPAAPDPRQRQSHQTRMAALLWSRRRASPIYAFIVQSWDTAAKTSELNDYSVCPTWGVERENYYLIDVFRRRLNYPDLKRAIVSHAETFDADKIVIEAKARAPNSSRTFITTASGRSSSTNRRLAPTRSCASTPAATGSKAAVWSCRATPPGWTSTSLSSSAFQAQNTTTRSTRPPRRWTTSASLTSSLPTSRHFRGDVTIQQLSDDCCRGASRLLISRTRLEIIATIAGHPHSELAGANACLAAIDDPSEHPARAPAAVR